MRIHSPYPASWALAQRIGYLYSEGEIIYLADTPFERLLDIQRQVGQCQTMTSLSQADFEARLEADCAGYRSIRRSSLAFGRDARK